MVRQHEDGHLELIAADVRVGVRHLEGLPPHEHGAGLLDGGVHVCGSLQGRKVSVEAVDIAIRIGNEAAE